MTVITVSLLDGFPFSSELPSYTTGVVGGRDGASGGCT